MPYPKVGTKAFKPCRCACRWRCQCLTFRTRKPGPPFGVGAKLDVKIGLHPKLVSLPPNSPPVGTYDLPAIKSKCPVPSWKKEEETEEFASTMGGHLLEKYVVQRRLMKTGRGPGTHDIIRWPENISSERNEIIKRDVGFGTSARFQTAKSNIPGPGYTRKFHNPYHYLEQNRFKSPSKIPPFEFDGLAPRFQEIRSFSQPCNVYNVKHPDSLETVLKKVTGKRGPYQLFTGPRDSSTLVGYLARSKGADTKSWPFTVPNEIDKLLHKSNYFKGRWTNCPRFLKKPAMRMLLNDITACYKDPAHPGPGHYDPKSPRRPKNAKQYPFDSCIEHVRPLLLEKIHPGPGRYRLKEHRRIKGDGWTCVFRSNVPRTIATFLPKTYNSF